jgi:hypothetical protein
MRQLILIFAFGLSLVSGVAAATATTTVIDFEDFAVGQFASPVFTQGFVIDPALAQFDAAIFTDIGPVGSVKKLGLCLHCDDGPEGISIYRNDGKVFELDSFDLAFQALVFPGTITGYLSGGGTISTGINTTGIVVFDELWVGLSSVDITFSAPASNDFQVAFIDDITLQAVPVPAAVWLFGSGLSILGWLRRRRSA